MALWGFCFTCLNYVGNPTQQFLTSGASFLTDHNNKLHVHLLCFAELTIAQTFMLLFHCITSYSSQEWILVHYWNMEWRNQIKPLFIYCDKFSTKKVWETQRGIIQANNDNNQLFFFSIWILNWIRLYNFNNNNNRSKFLGKTKKSPD